MQEKPACGRRLGIFQSTRTSAGSVTESECRRVEVYWLG